MRKETKPRVGPLLVTAALLFSLTPAQINAQWLEAKGAHYVVIYQPGSEKDVAFTRRWLDHAEMLMKSKYGVSPIHYHLSIYLYPAPADDIDVDQSGQIKCCTRTAAGLSTGTIKLLALSAPVWKTANLRSSLGLAKSGEDYHAKVLMSEYIPIGHYAVQDARGPGGWQYYDAPEWFVQGLQEYDGIFHTTDTNRTLTAGRLFAWAKRNTAKFSCCSPKLQIVDAYNGGATFLAFLADEFGEGIHARLLRSSAKTFDAALDNETKRYSRDELFARFRKWLDGNQVNQP